MVHCPHDNTFTSFVPASLTRSWQPAVDTCAWTCLLIPGEPVSLPSTQVLSTSETTDLEKGASLLIPGEPVSLPSTQVLSTSETTDSEKGARPTRRGYELTLRAAGRRFAKPVARLAFRLHGTLHSTSTTPLFAAAQDTIARASLDQHQIGPLHHDLQYVGDLQDVEVLMDRPSCCACCAPWTIRQLEVKYLTSGTLYTFMAVWPTSTSERNRLLLQYPRAHVVTSDVHQGQACVLTVETGGCWCAG